MGVMYKIVEGNPPKLSEKYSVELQALYERYVPVLWNQARFMCESREHVAFYIPYKKY